MGLVITSLLQIDQLCECDPFYLFIISEQWTVYQLQNLCKSWSVNFKYFDKMLQRHEKCFGISIVSSIVSYY